MGLSGQSIVVLSLQVSIKKVLLLFVIAEALSLFLYPSALFSEQKCFICIQSNKSDRRQCCFRQFWKNNKAVKTKRQCKVDSDKIFAHTLAEPPKWIWALTKTLSVPPNQRAWIGPIQDLCSKHSKEQKRSSVPIDSQENSCFELDWKVNRTWV